MPKVKSVDDIQKMRKAGRLAALTLQHVEPYIVPGVSTEEINARVHEFIVAHGAYPSPLKYRGFPKSVCTSVNEVICHGIPSETHILHEGDIVNVDVTATLEGYFGDTSRTYFVGKEIPKERRIVTEVAEESLARALVVIHHGCHVGDIGEAIQTYAEGMGCAVVRDFGGHGIGKVFHENDLHIPHFGRKGSGQRLTRNMTFTVEPMINYGRSWGARVLKDGWTAVTLDGMPSAQFEHTLAITGEGIEVFTALPDDSIVKRARELGAHIVIPE